MNGLLGLLSWLKARLITSILTLEGVKNQETVAFNHFLAPELLKVEGQYLTYKQTKNGKKMRQRNGMCRYLWPMGPATEIKLNDSKAIIGH
jgi:hypothetical protein